VPLRVGALGNLDKFGSSLNSVIKDNRPSQYRNISDWISDVMRFPTLCFRRVSSDTSFIVVSMPSGLKRHTHRTH